MAFKITQNSKLKSQNHNLKLKTKNTKVLVAMSGGVDSSVVAAMLKKQGHKVIGVFLKFWSPPCDSGQARMTFKENICCNQEALRSARSVASKLKIPFYVFDAVKEFKRDVVDYYINEYDSGRTPNPCVVCNKKIKFGWLSEKAKKLGCRYIATGHYAKIESACLYKPKDTKKDQTYFLWQLSHEQLQHILFPLGNYTKEDVRKMAKKWKLPTAEKKESQNACFVPDGNNENFLQTYAKKLIKPGNIVDKEGNILGKHKGLYKYTVGQRKGLPQLKISNFQFPHSTSSGLAISNKIPKSKFQISKHRIPPLYVIKLDIEKNELVVGVEKDLYSKKLIAEKVNWIDKKLHATRYTLQDLKCKAKIRYGHRAASCKLETVNCKPKTLKVIFDKPQRSITPGQSAVFYTSKGELIGGGIIK